MFSIQDGLDLVLGSFILLLCVFHLYFQSVKHAYYEAAKKVSLYFSAVLPLFLLKRPALRSHAFYAQRLISPNC